MNKWPFPDNNLVRARKIALAYRHLAQEQYKELKAVFDQLNRSGIIISLYDPATNTMHEQLLPLNEPHDDVAELDQRFIAWGERWHADIVIPYNDDDLINSDEAGKLIHLTPYAVTNARTRGALKGTWMRGPDDNRGRWYFRVADLYAYSASTKGHQVDRESSSR